MTPGSALVWTGAEAAARLSDPASADEMLTAPALVIDLRDCDPALAAPPSLARLACPVLALVASSGQLAWPVDLALAEDASDTRLLASDATGAAERLARAAAEAPTAAAVLAQLLRTTGDLAAESALVLESMAYSLLLTGTEFRGWLTSRSVPRAQQDGGPTVVVSRQGGQLEVTLDRPAVRNAYNARMRDELAEALGLALLDPSIDRVVLRGNGPSFCSGGDLREFGRSADLAEAHLRRVTRSPAALLHRIGSRTQVRLHGRCVGAGVELAAFCGRVVARADAVLQLPEMAMGTIPGAGGTVSLPRRIGRQRTLLLALSGLALGVEDALRWGLVDALDPDVCESDVFD